MNAVKWTPLKILRDQFDQRPYLATEDGTCVAASHGNISPADMDRVRTGEREASITRLADCWNFLSAHPGLSVVEVVGKTVLIDSIHAMTAATAEITALRATNEKLLEALKAGEEILAIICEVICPDNPPPHGLERLALMRAAIASAGGAQ